MNVPTFTDLRPADVSGLADEKMEQVREILFGDSLRVLETRMRILEARLADLEHGVMRRLDVVEARLHALSSTAEADRRASFESLARSISDLGEQIHRIARG